MSQNSSSLLGTCRHCRAPLSVSMTDLGMSPLCQSQVTPKTLQKGEVYYPLNALVCTECYLVQLGEFVSPDQIFNEDYAYFSSFSSSWLEHAKKYVEMMVDRFHLGSQHQVVEIASNDGYLLQYFHEKKIPVLGIEPSTATARAAEAKGIPCLKKFFGVQTAQEVVASKGKAHLILGNNVLAHVPNLHDFIGGVKTLLDDNGIFTFEFPHLYQLMEQNQFDTIYHEHFSYFSFSTVQNIFKHHQLTLFDVEELWSHGGSLRLFGKHTGNSDHPETKRVAELLQKEKNWGVFNLQLYKNFNQKVTHTKRKILNLLIQLKNEGKTICGYAAAGKTNTLLNFCGIGTDMIDFTVDRNPAKQGNYLPGSRIPIYPPEALLEKKPDYLFVGAWNLKNEIMQQTSYIKEWGGKWIIPIPEPKVYD